MNKFQSIKPFVLCLGVCGMLLGGCGPKVDNGGYIREDGIADKIVVGKSSREDVKNNLGSPSAQSSFGDETWYYVTSRKEAYAFLKPHVVKRDVMEISFDSAGIVKKVDNYTKDNGEDIDIARRTTPTEGHTMGFWEQVLGNVGRFNHPQDQNGPAPGRQPGS